MPIPNIFVNSNYTNKHIVDADKLNENFEYLLNQIGGSPIKNLIVSSGQSYNESNINQVITAIIQYVLAGQYFIDESELANNVILAPSVSSYSVPAVYVDKMEFLFTPAFSNTGAVTMIFKGFDSLSNTKPLLSRTGSTLIDNTILAGNTYAVHYDANIITGGAFVLGSLRSTSSSSSTDASGSLEYLLGSLNIEYNKDIYSQLSQAIAEYALFISYNDISTFSDQTSNLYRVKPFPREGSNIVSVETPFEYYNGMTIRFKPSFSNTQSSSLIIDGFSSSVEIRNIDDSITEAGDICQNVDVVVRYYNGKFYIVSNKQSTLSLTYGVKVNGIENTLSSSTNKLPTSNAVYTELDLIKDNINILSNEIAATDAKPFSVVKGPEASDNQAYISYDSSNTTFSMLRNTIVNYANREIEVLETNSQLSVDPSTMPSEYKLLYVKGSGLVVVNPNNYLESYSAPTTGTSIGDAYVYIDPYNRIRTYIYDGSAWNETSFVKVGFGTVISTVVDDETVYTVNLYVPPLCGYYNSANLAVPDFSTDSLIITHNFDSLCNVKVKLVCVDDDLAYNIGESVELAPYTTTNEYFFIGNTKTSTVINSSGLLLPNSSGVPTAITASKWKFFINIERAF